MLKVASLVEQIDQALQVYEQQRASAKYDDLSDLKSEVRSETITLLGATIERVAPHGSIYRRQADDAYARYGRDNSYILAILTGVLRATRADYLAGRLQTVGELIHADLFSDFLDMAHHLHSEGYKDAAAVIAGSVLESHLKKLCQKHGIPLEINRKPKKADTINSELVSAGVYSKLDQKSVTAWLGLRNSAAHGQYGDYSKDQVALLVQSVGDFVSRYAA